MHEAAAVCRSRHTSITRTCSRVEQSEQYTGTYCCESGTFGNLLSFLMQKTHQAR